MKRTFLLKMMLLLCALVAGSSSVWAAEGDSHDFSQSLQQLLNNNASITSINIAKQDYPVKEVIVSYRYNKTLTNAVTMNVSVGGTSWGSFDVNGTGDSYTTHSFSNNAVKDAITISFTNNTGDGTGHGTFYVNKVTLVEGVLPSHNVVFSVNGVESDPVAVKEGEEITFPADPAAIGGKEFVGWTTTAISGTTDDAPTVLVTSATMGDDDVTYYAVFAKETTGEGNVTLTITKDTENFPTSYGTAKTFTEYTLEGKKFKIQQAYINNSKLQWRSGTDTSNGAGTIYNTDALNKIQSIVLTYNGDNNKNFTVQVGDTENPTSGTPVSATGTDNVRTYDCSSYNKNYFVLTNGDKAGYLDAIAITYKAETTVYSAYCTSVTATITLASACTDGSFYYGTYSNGTAFVVPSDLIVSEISVTGGQLNIVDYDTDDVVPANTGVLVVSDVAGGHTVTLTTEAGTSKLGDDNMLKPSGDNGVTASDMADTDYYYYRLTMYEGKPGFWWKSDNGTGFALAANKAYLKVLISNAGTITSQASGFTLGDHETTGVNDVRSKTEEVRGEYFNLAGQRVAQPTKGLYIVNGRKVVIK